MSNYINIVWPGHGGVVHFALHTNLGSGADVWFEFTGLYDLDSALVPATYETQHGGVEYWQATLPWTGSGYDIYATARAYSGSSTNPDAFADLWVCGDYNSGGGAQ